MGSKCADQTNPSYAEVTETDELYFVCPMNFKFEMVLLIKSRKKLSHTNFQNFLIKLKMNTFITIFIVYDIFFWIEVYFILLVLLSE